MSPRFGTLVRSLLVNLKENNQLNHLATSILWEKKYQRTYVLAVPGHLHNPVFLTGAPLKISRRTKSRRHAVSTFNKCLNSVADLGVSHDPNRNRNVGHDFAVVTIRKDSFWSCFFLSKTAENQTKLLLWDSTCRIAVSIFFGVKNPARCPDSRNGLQIPA